MIFLEVPFQEKDQAKALGARWDRVARKWYIPDELEDNSDQFNRWLKTDNSSIEAVDSSSMNLDFNGHSPKEIEAPKGVPLSKLLLNIQNALRHQFPGALWVQAEVSNLSHNRGHVYLELSETNASGKTEASCRATLWKSQAERLLSQFKQTTGSELAVGHKVLLLAEVALHAQYGFSLNIVDIDSSFTLGELEAKLNQARKQLITEGIYTQNQQLSLPNDFFRVAVIAPPGAAGLGDFRADADLLHKQALCDFTYFYSSFQGDNVVKEFKAAFEAVRSLHESHSFDALVVIRGGGAKLDLGVLNEYEIAQQICLSGLPVMTGIGHERDNTLLDEVANTRFDTPSKVIAGIRHAIFQQAQQAKQSWITIERSSQLAIKNLDIELERINQSITQNSLQNLNLWKQRIEPLIHTLLTRGRLTLHNSSKQLQHYHYEVVANTEKHLKTAKIEVEQAWLTSKQGARKAIEFQKNQSIQWIAFILSSGPKTQLNRGFALAKTTDGAPVTSAEQAKIQDHIVLEFKDGNVRVTPDDQSTKR